LTEVNEVWCYPGILAGFACGSFHKAILDEEMMRYSNRVLQGVEMTVASELLGLLADGQQAGSFLVIGSMDTYRRDNYLTKLFNKWGIAQAGNAEKTNLACKVQQVLERRMAAYQLPERSATQKKLLQPYLPSQCRY
jgi:trimethylamine---corrinoid protein Co-methyltransferase